MQMLLIFCGGFHNQRTRQAETNLSRRGSTQFAPAAKQAVEGNALAEAGLHLVSPAMAASPPLQQIENACTHG